jgi:hypothetical protein
MTDISTPLTDDEATVLQIAAQQGTIGAIGRWESTVKSLVRRGFLQDMTGDFFNCQITETGKSASAESEAELDRALGRMRKMAIAQESIQEMAEKCAQVLVKIARMSHEETGTASVDAAVKWSGVILDRAKELLR